jgi:hypothetical protein
MCSPAAGQPIGDPRADDATRARDPAKAPMDFRSRGEDKERMRIECKSCSAAIPAADVNLDRMMAKCRSCDAVFSIEPQPDAAPPTRPALHRAPPSGIEVEVDAPFAELSTPESYREPVPGADPGVLTVRRRWFQPGGLFLLLFAFVWDAFLVFWYSMAIMMDGPIIMILFPLLHVAVGIGVTYGALATILNRTTIRCDREAITVTHRPLPWPHAGSTAVASVRRVFVDGGQRRKNGRALYRVLAETETVGDRVLLSGVPQLQAEHVASVIREHLRIFG